MILSIIYKALNSVQEGKKNKEKLSISDHLSYFSNYYENTFTSNIRILSLICDTKMNKYLLALILDSICKYFNDTFENCFSLKDEQHGGWEDLFESWLQEEWPGIYERAKELNPSNPSLVLTSRPKYINAGSLETDLLLSWAEWVLLDKEIYNCVGKELVEFLDEAEEGKNYGKYESLEELSTAIKKYWPELF